MYNHDFKSKVVKINEIASLIFCSHLSNHSQEEEKWHSLSNNYTLRYKKIILMRKNRKNLQFDEY